MNKKTDIIIIGAGPAGLTFARQFANSSFNISIIDKNPVSVLENPPFDGREIALTHFTKNFLEKSNIWQLIADDKKYPLKEAKVENGDSNYQLYFHQPTFARGKAIEQLGFLISNEDIRRACYQAVLDLPNVNLITETSLQYLHINDNGVEVVLSNNETLSGQLLICADGRFSTTRQRLGIPADTHQFGRTVICFRVEHELSNQHTAFECFHYGRTLAILPLEEHISSMVITIDTNLAENIMNMTDDELVQDMYKETKGRLGKIKILSKRNSYPLIGVHASRFYDKRTALIGDAAVGMHPVTAHGFNLGVESVAILSNLIFEAAKKNTNIASETLLERYNLKHQAKTRIIYHGTNFVVNLFTSESRPARLLRSSIIHLSNNLNPIKKLISKQLTG